MTDTRTMPPRPKQPTTINGTPQGGPAPAKKNAAPLRGRRRPVMLAIGGTIVAVSIVGSYGVVSSLRSTQEVVVLAKDISQGKTIEASDLTTVKINTDAGLQVVLSTSRDQIIGRTVTSNQKAGSLLNPTELTAAVIPPKTKSVVGITLTPDKMPGIPLEIGDIIRIVDTPREQEPSPATAPISTNAQIVAITTADSAAGAQATIDVLVPEAEASWVAARAATHRVAVVLDTRER